MQRYVSYTIYDSDCYTQVYVSCIDDKYLETICDTHKDLLVILNIEIRSLLIRLLKTK